MPKTPAQLLLNRPYQSSRKLLEILVRLLVSVNHSLSSMLVPVLDSTINAPGLLSTRMPSNLPDHLLNTACNPIAMHISVPPYDALDRLLDSKIDNQLAPLQAYEISHLMSPRLKVCLEAQLPCGLFLAPNRKKGS